jgi:hypothetical protein
VVYTTLFLLDSVDLPPVSSKGVIEGKEVEHKVAKFERNKSFRVSELWGARDDPLAFEKAVSDDLAVENGGKSRRR